MAADGNRRAAPDGTTGYYRGGAPRYGGTGSMAGPSGAGIVTDKQAWQPTVKYMLGLVVIELLLYGFLRSYTRHGG